MSALQHYLFEEDLKAGDTGAAARIAAEKEEMVHQQNIKAVFSSNRQSNANVRLVFRIMRKRTEEFQR